MCNCNWKSADSCKNCSMKGNDVNVKTMGLKGKSSVLKLACTVYGNITVKDLIELQTKGGLSK